MAVDNFKVRVGVELEKNGVQTELDKVKGLKLKNVDIDIDESSLSGTKVKIGVNQTHFRDELKKAAVKADVKATVGVNLNHFQSEFKNKVKSTVENAKNLRVKVGAELEKDWSAGIKQKIENETLNVNLDIDKAAVRNLVTTDDVLTIDKATVQHLVSSDGSFVIPEATVKKMTSADGSVTIPKAVVSELASADGNIVIPKAMVQNLIASDGSLVIPKALAQQIVSQDGKMDVDIVNAKNVTTTDGTMEVQNAVVKNNVKANIEGKVVDVDTNGTPTINVEGRLTGIKSVDDKGRVLLPEQRHMVDKDIYGKEQVPSVRRSNVALNEIVENHLKGNAKLAPTADNIRGLYDYAINQQKKAGKMDASKNFQEIATIEKLANQTLAEADNLYERYERQINNRIKKLREAIKEDNTQLKHNTGLSDAEKKSFKSSRDKNVKELASKVKEKNQLDTHLNRSALRASEDQSVYDAAQKDAKALEERNQKFQRYIALLKEEAKWSNKSKMFAAQGKSGELNNANNRLNNIGRSLEEAKSSIDFKYNDAELKILRETLEGIDKRAKEVDGRIIDIKAKSDAKKVNADLDHLIKKEKELAKKKEYLAGLDETHADFQRATADVSRLENEVDQLKSSLGGVSLSKLEQGKLNTAQFEKYKNAMTEIGNVSEKTANKVKEAQKKMAQNITGDMGDLGKTTTNLKKLNNEFDKISHKSDVAKNALAQHAQSYERLEAAVKEYNAEAAKDANSADTMAKLRKIIALNEDVARSGKEAQRAISQNKTESRNIEANEKFLEQQKAMMSTMNLWEKKNSKVMQGNSQKARELAQEFVRLKQRINECDNAADFRKLKGEFDDLKKRVQAAGKDGLSTIDKLKNKFSEYASYAVASMGIMEVVQGLRRMAQEVLEVDTAMTGLLRVTEMTNNETTAMFDKMAASSKEYGRTLTDTINATADWVRAGFDENTALGLAEVTAMYQNVSDLDYAESSENLLTSYRGFEKQLMLDYENDAVAANEHIVDVLNELDKQSCP